MKRIRRPGIYEELRRLEREAASGDPLALDRLHRCKARSGLPAHYHDCDGCVFLGSEPITTWKEPRNTDELGCNYHFYDLYYCPSSNVLGGSLLARYACNGSQYASWPLDVYLAHPEIQDGIRKRIYDLAIAHGLVG